MVSYSILTVVVLSNVWVAYVIFSACTPLEAFWDTTIMPAVCHPMAFWLSNQYLFITTDFLIFLLPIPVVWALKVRMGQKMLLVFLFTMGFLYVYLPPSKQTEESRLTFPAPASSPSSASSWPPRLSPTAAST